mmetsp:Transcript_32086/g.82170  ORF Transcript_32086/g.82170 Transcript_32086/m.82170 type:complete len:132 (+) Transcript_32086:207-602(+)|eukprot:jgi/Tetstr1/432828/TSEL_022179.t1
MEEAAARKARLKALRERAGGAEGGEAPVLRFRNYAPRDQTGIAHEKVEAAKAPTAEELPVAFQAAEDEGEEAPPEDTMVGVAPKKANWDLRRDVEPKLAKLERRTQRAMVELMTEEEGRRLQEDGGVADEE